MVNVFTVIILKNEDKHWCGFFVSDIDPLGGWQTFRAKWKAESFVERQTLATFFFPELRARAEGHSAFVFFACTPRRSRPLRLRIR